MLTAISSSGRQVTRSEVVSFFTANGLPYHEAYIEFLCKHNGGRPKPKFFPIKGLEMNPFGDVKLMFQLDGALKACDLQATLDSLPASVPKGVFPIAENGGGDYICIDMRQPTMPVVFFDYHEFWGNNLWHEGLLYPVADNFEAFLNSLDDMATYQRTKTS